jgi:glycosyltransferase involved in cell wall biosynthesis
MEGNLVNPSVNGAQPDFDAELVQLEVADGNDVVVDLTGGEVSVTSRPHLSVVQPPKVSVVVPTLNEAKNLPHVFELLAKQDIHEVVVVDGFSTDDTVEVARALRPDVRIVHQTRRGKGNALKHGFEAATGDIIVMLDADGSADPGEIPAYVEALVNGADFAKGTRFARGGGSTDITPLRRAGNWGLNTLTNVLYRSKFTDLCYGYNAFWAKHVPVMNVDCDGFEVETLINVRVHKAGLKIAEVGSFEADRIHGTSNLNTFRDGWRVLKTIFKERVRRTTAAATSAPAVDEAAA